jgi:hypothetical protein
VLKDIADLVAPYIAELFSRSLANGHYPAGFKHAFVTPIVKKAGLDTSDIGSYRPISNLSVLSKLFERLVARQLWHYLQLYKLLPTLQSGFRPGHSTETAIIHVLSDILAAVDGGKLAALVLLDLSTAFNTVDHKILLERMQRTFGITDRALHWLASYLTGRTECVRRGSSCSAYTCLTCGVPQGSVLGPLLFVLYTVDLPSLIEQHGLTPHLYADDTQVYGFCRPSEVGEFTARLASCVADVAVWMRTNRLQMNVDKTELMWFSTPRQHARLPSDTVVIGGHDVKPTNSARNLGVFFDADLSMRRHVDVVVSRCFAALRQLRAVRQYVAAPVMQSLVTSLVLTRMDYCNGVFFGLPEVQLSRLQTIQNSAARLIYKLRRSDHISDALISLHWLRVAERIRYKMAVMTYRALHGQMPSYLADFVPISTLLGRANLRSSTTHHLHVPRTKLRTIGDRAFPVAGATIWNELPPYVATSPSLNIFRSRLKTFLFSQSYPGIVV